MNHLSKKQCIDLMLGIFNAKKTANFTSHIENCTECREQINAILPVIKPGIKEKVKLSKNLKKRILNSAAQIRDAEKEQENYNTLKHRITRPAVLFPAISIGAIAIFFILFSFAEFNTNGTFLHVARMYGRAEINAIPARIYDIVSSGNTISTDDDSIMMLRSPSDHKIMIFSKSQMTVEKAKMDDSKNLEVKYSLDKGIVYNKHNDEDTPIKYAFATPNAIINAEDADMMLQVSDKTSRILLIKGKIIVRDPNSSKNMIIDSPGKYVIFDGIKTEKQYGIATTDSQKIDEALTINDNADESIMPAENFNTNPAYNDNIPKLNKSLINTVKYMLSE